jgi:hypothetical protein
MSYYAPLPASLDCSDAAQDARKQQIAELKAKMALGVLTVGDRGRSVSYRTTDDMLKAIALLQADLNACVLGHLPGRKRLAHIDLVKGL